MSAVPSSRRSSRLSDRFKPSLVCQTCLILTSLPTASAGEQTLLANQAVSQTTVKSEVSKTQAQSSHQSETTPPAQTSTEPTTIAAAESAQDKTAALENTALESAAQNHELVRMKAKAQALRQAIEMSPIPSFTPSETIVDTTDSTQDKPLAPKNATPQTATSNGEVTKAKAQTAKASQTKTSAPIQPYTPPQTITPVKKIAEAQTATPQKVIQNDDATVPPANKSRPIEPYRPPQTIVSVTAPAETKKAPPKNSTQTNEVAQPQAPVPQAKTSSPIAPYTPPKTIAPIKKSTGASTTTAKKSIPKKDTQNGGNKQVKPQATAPELPQFLPNDLTQASTASKATADVIEAIKAKAIAQIKASQTNDNKVTKPEAKALASPQFPPMDSIKSATLPAAAADAPESAQDKTSEPNNATPQNTAQSNEVAQPQAPALELTQFPPISSIKPATLTQAAAVPESTPAQNVEPNNDTTKNTAQNNEVVSIDDAPIIITGISITLNKRTYERSSATSVRGFGYGETREEFAQWLIPLGTVLEALEIKSRQISEQELELTSKFAVARLDLTSLTNDPELGLTISVKQVEDLLKIPARFDLQDGTIVFDLPNVTTTTTPSAERRKNCSLMIYQWLMPQVFPLAWLSNV